MDLLKTLDTQATIGSGYIIPGLSGLEAVKFMNRPDEYALYQNF
jgi:hypothetical protein